MRIYKRLRCTEDIFWWPVRCGLICSLDRIGCLLLIAHRLDSFCRLRTLVLLMTRLYSTVCIAVIEAPWTSIRETGSVSALEIRKLLSSSLS
ncbi:hypothetical protein VTO42DRAFT_6322 [Malbranchea cinnamomea]